MEIHWFCHRATSSFEGPGKDAAAEEIREIEELRCSAIQREGWDWLGFVGSTTEA